MLEVLAALSLAAAPVAAPKIHPNDWQALIHRIGEKGEYFEPSGEIGPRFELKDIRGPERAPHRAEYIDLWGGLSGGRFFPAYVRLVSEDWRAFKPSDSDSPKTRERCSKETCLYIDQWIFTLKLDGSIMDFLHDGDVENPGMDVIESLWFRPTEGEGKTELGRLLSAWYRFEPKKP